MSGTTVEAALVAALNAELADTRTGPLSDTPYIDTEANGDLLYLYDARADVAAGSFDTGQLARALIAKGWRPIA